MLQGKPCTRVALIGAVVVVGGLINLAPQFLQGQGRSPGMPNRVLTVPVDVTISFLPSGYMGDGERNRENVRVTAVVGEKPRSGDSDNMCTKVEYQPGPTGWAGMYWLSPADNWGDKPGYAIKGEPQRITFWAAGARGNEIVEFKAGGIKAGKRFSDSFEVSTGSTRLSTDWREYQISLKGKDLSSVLGGFAWIVTGASNPHGLVFYIDQIRYE